MGKCRNNAVFVRLIDERGSCYCCICTNTNVSGIEEELN